MKKILLFMLLAFGVNAVNATIVEVEVGGSLSVTPYYSPQFITIDQGDTVQWNWVLGTHNVTSTSGPIAFSSGDVDSPDEWQFHFLLTGTYTYECTLFNHADTQFGSITVVNVSGVDENTGLAVTIYPNPVTDMINIDFEGSMTVQDSYLIDVKGSKIDTVISSEGQINVSDLKNGVHVLVIETSEGIIRKRILIQK